MNFRHPKCTNCSQSACLINKHCTQKWKSFLDEHKSFGTYNNRQTIFQEGNIVFGVFFIYDGKIKIFNTGKNGKHHVTRLAKSGEMLGLRGFAEKRHLLSGISLGDSSLCFFAKDIFIKTLKENPDFALNIIQFYAQELANIEIRQKHFTQLTIKERIAEALLLLKKKYGVQHAGKNEIFLDVMLIRQDIADIAGASTEEVIRVLSQFNKEQLIKIDGQKLFILNSDKLSELMLASYHTKSVHPYSAASFAYLSS